MSDTPLSSSPAPGPGLEDQLRYYKKQYEILESELADFQSSSKDLEAELERDIETAEKRERQLKEQAANLKYEVDEWKEKHKQAKSEAGTAQAALEREIKQLRQENLTLRQQVRDIEVANDDYERKQRTTEVSLEDMEQKYNQTIERAVMLEEEVKSGEQERESLRIEAQRLKDEYSDFKVEAEIVKKRLDKAEEDLAGRVTPLLVKGHAQPASPRSELSPTTTDASGPSFDTPPRKTMSSGVSDAPTPPSPATSEKSAAATKVPQTPTLQKTRLSIPTAANPTRPPFSSRANGHTRGASVVNFSRPQPNVNFRQSINKPGAAPLRGSGLPQSSSIIHLRNLRGKMAKLEERVQTAKSKLPGPTGTPPRGSPRSGSVQSNIIPSSVTMRSRRRGNESVTSGNDSLDNDHESTPSISRTRTHRQSLTHRPASPIRQSTAMAAPPRPSSRTSTTGHRSSLSNYQSLATNRPNSRASITGLRTLANPPTFAPNASTDRVRPQSSLSNHATGYDGAFDEENEVPAGAQSPRKSTYTKRTSDVGTAIPTPSPSKRASLSGRSHHPGLSRRQSGGLGIGRPPSSASQARPPSRQVLNDVDEARGYDPNETF